MCFCSTAHCAAAAMGRHLAPGLYFCPYKTNFPENHFHFITRGKPQHKHNHSHAPPPHHRCPRRRGLGLPDRPRQRSGASRRSCRERAYLDVRAERECLRSTQYPRCLLAHTGTEPLLPRSRRPTPRPAATSRAIRPHVSPLPTFHVSLPSLPIAPLTSTRSPAAHTHTPHPPSFTAS